MTFHGHLCLFQTHLSLKLVLSRFGLESSLQGRVGLPRGVGSLLWLRNLEQKVLTRLGLVKIICLCVELGTIGLKQVELLQVRLRVMEYIRAQMVDLVLNLVDLGFC